MLVDMFESTDWTKSEQVEGVRRSIAMLQTGAWGMTREPALMALDQLIALLRAERAAAQMPPPADLLPRIEARVRQGGGRPQAPRARTRPGGAA